MLHLLTPLTQEQTLARLATHPVHGKREDEMENTVPLKGVGIIPRGNATLSVDFKRLGRVDASFEIMICFTGDAVARSHPETLAELRAGLAPGGTGLPPKLRLFVARHLMGDPALSDEALCVSVGHLILSAAVATWDRSRTSEPPADVPVERTLPGHEMISVRYQSLAWGEWIATIVDGRPTDKEPPAPIRVSLEQLRRYLDRMPDGLPEDFRHFATSLAPTASTGPQIVKIGTQVLEGAPRHAH